MFRSVRQNCLEIRRNFVRWGERDTIAKPTIAYQAHVFGSSCPVRFILRKGGECDINTIVTPLPCLHIQPDTHLMVMPWQNYSEETWWAGDGGVILMQWPLLLCLHIRPDIQQSYPVGIILQLEGTRKRECMLQISVIHHLRAFHTGDNQTCSLLHFSLSSGQDRLSGCGSIPWMDGTSRLPT